MNLFSILWSVPLISSNPAYFFCSSSLNLGIVIVWNLWFSCWAFSFSAFRFSIIYSSSVTLFCSFISTSLFESIPDSSRIFDLSLEYFSLLNLMSSSSSLENSLKFSYKNLCAKVNYWSSFPMYPCVMTYFISLVYLRTDKINFFAL